MDLSIKKNRPILTPGRGSWLSEIKKSFFSFRVIILIVVALNVVTIIAASGILYIPGFSEVLGTNKPRDLGVKADPALFNALLAKENVKLTGQTSDFYLTTPIRYRSAVPMDATISSEEKPQ